MISSNSKAVPWHSIQTIRVGIHLPALPQFPGDEPMFEPYRPAPGFDTPPTTFSHRRIEKSKKVGMKICRPFVIWWETN